MGRHGESDAGSDEGYAPSGDEEERHRERQAREEFRVPRWQGQDAVGVDESGSQEELRWQDREPQEKRLGKEALRERHRQVKESEVLRDATSSPPTSSAVRHDFLS